MKFGVWIPSYCYPDLSYQRAQTEVGDFARKANDLGIDLWVIDHLLHAPGLYGMPWLEPMTTLTWAAALAPDVSYGTGILVLPLRNPVILAKEIATLDYLTGDDVTFDGKYYQFENVTIQPRPPKMPEVWVAGGSRIPDPEFHDLPVLSPAVLNRILDADAWISRCSGNQEWIKRDWGQIREGLAARGRPVESLKFAHTNFTYIVDTANREKAHEIQQPFFEQVMGSHRTFQHLQECYLLGTPDDIVERLKDLESAGCEYVVLGPTSDQLDQLDLINDRIISAFR